MDAIKQYRKRKKLARQRNLLKRVQVNGRECGPCKACCTIMAVGSLKKPMFKTCQHVCERGCTIYERRPPECVGWHCLWRLGNMMPPLVLPDKMRPDQCGLMVDLRVRLPGEFDGFVKSDCKWVIDVYELRSGAAEANADALDALVKISPVIVYSPEIKASVWRIPDIKVKTNWRTEHLYGQPLPERIPLDVIS